MGTLVSLTLILLSLELSEALQSPRFLDLAIRRYAVDSSRRRSRTGVPHPVHLPANLSGIRVDAARFRCGSLRRHGGRVRAFHLGVGLSVPHCAERVILVAQELRRHWSALYSRAYNLTGYRLVSPVLGLLAYRGGANSSSPGELEIVAGKAPIAIDFGNLSRNVNPGAVPLCASFGDDGRVRVARQVRPGVCWTAGKGHFGIVIELPAPEPPKKRVSKRKAVAVISIGAVLGMTLMALLLVAMSVKVKKKNRLEEMERRAYEEEAMQVTMVGHVRAPTAPATRTVPTMEHFHNPLRRPP